MQALASGAGAYGLGGMLGKIVGRLMPNILKRPMFKLGGTPNSDGVGITSGMQRKNYARRT